MPVEIFEKSSGTWAPRLGKSPAFPAAPLNPIYEVEDFAFADGAGRYTGHLLIGETEIAPGTYRIAPGTSTHASDVPVQGTGKTNPLRLLRAGGNGAGTRMTGLEFTGVVIEGTEQGHLYGGVQILWTEDLLVEGCSGFGIKGNANGPPGETFMLEVYQAQDPIIRNCHLDGGNVSSTHFGINNGSNALVENCSAHANAWGMSIAVWMSEGHTIIRDCDFSDCKHPINFEQYLGGGLVEIDNVDFRGQRDQTSNPATTRPHITFNSARGSSQLIVREPLWDEAKGPFQVGIAAPGSVVGWGTTNQLREDLTVIKGGVDMTQTSRVRIGY